MIVPASLLQMVGLIAYERDILDEVLPAADSAFSEVFRHIYRD